MNDDLLEPRLLPRCRSASCRAAPPGSLSALARHRPHRATRRRRSCGTRVPPVAAECGRYRAAKGGPEALDRHVSRRRSRVLQPDAARYDRAAATAAYRRMISWFDSTWPPSQEDRWIRGWQDIEAGDSRQRHVPDGRLFTGEHTQSHRHEHRAGRRHRRRGSRRARSSSASSRVPRGRRLGGSEGAPATVQAVGDDWAVIIPRASGTTSLTPAASRSRSIPSTHPGAPGRHRSSNEGGGRGRRD